MEQSVALLLKESGPGKAHARQTKAARRGNLVYQLLREDIAVLE